jgi:hypothetical protein
LGCVLYPRSYSNVYCSDSEPGDVELHQQIHNIYLIHCKTLVEST